MSHGPGSVDVETHTLVVWWVVAGSCGIASGTVAWLLWRMWQQSTIPPSWRGYTGATRHTRLKDAPYSFTQSMYLDWFHLADPPAIGSILYLDESDHITRDLCNHSDVALPEVKGACLYDRICHMVGYRASVYLLTNLRFMGHCFNSISIYYCLANDTASGTTDEHLTSANLTHLVLEVWNTPWNEVTMYVCRIHESKIVDDDRVQPKRMHVSPFNPPSHMNYAFSTDLTSFPHHLRVTIEVSDARGVVNVVSMSLARGPYRRFRMWLTMWNMLVIHLHAAVMFCKKHRVYEHSGHRRERGPCTRQ
jgi:DUF1365 family protein